MSAEADAIRAESDPSKRAELIAAYRLKHENLPNDIELPAPRPRDRDPRSADGETRFFSDAPADANQPGSE